MAKTAILEVGNTECLKDTTMAAATVSFETDEDTARSFASASAEERRKLELLLSLRLRELTSRPPRPLREVMDEISRNAEQRGMTPEILDSLLNDE